MDSAEIGVGIGGGRKNSGGSRENKNNGRKDSTKIARDHRESHIVISEPKILILINFWLNIYVIYQDL